MTDRSGSFVDNMKLPIHRWFRYSAGFSAQWAESVISSTFATRVLDPFAGSATTLIASDCCGVASVGIEAHPFVARIGQAKANWKVDPQELISCSAALLSASGSAGSRVDVNLAADLLKKCYEPGALAELIAIREEFLRISPDLAANVRELLFLAVTSILRECSFVGTAQWQYLLPNQKKSRVTSPSRAFTNKVAVMAADIAELRARGASPMSKVLAGDARQADRVVDGQFDLLLTSPPYPNNYDYADATRLEMTFWGDVSKWGDLHDSVRKYLVRSSSQHTAKDRLCLDDLLRVHELGPVSAELTEVCNQLAEVRETKGGKKTYHTMVAAYFADMAATLVSVRPLMKRGGKACLVIGDSAPYGVYVPADRWFGQLAISAGFKNPTFEKIRDRNTKWKNRKHTVPLKEGRLWVDC